MRRTAIHRALATLATMSVLAALSACAPDVPLIPFIKSDRAPSGTLAELTPPDRSPRASPVRRHTAP